ncbi:hypothetical protein DFH27DRAFT_605276 [Peziza echinospora]|nr:hypothetical protein DFH27DRAFT_605276 [Peziza echinospora]
MLSRHFHVMFMCFASQGVQQAKPPPGPWRTKGSLVTLLLARTLWHPSPSIPRLLEDPSSEAPVPSPIEMRLHTTMSNLSFRLLLCGTPSASRPNPSREGTRPQVW